MNSELDNLSDEERVLMGLEMLRGVDRAISSSAGDLDERIRELRLLIAIDHAISSTLDLDKIYELILNEGARKLIGATHGSVALVENGELVIKATMGDDWTDELRDTRLKVGEGITGWVAREGRPYLLRDVRQAGEQYASWFENVQSELAVPLKIGDRVKGVINVDSAVVDGFDEHAQQLLEALATQAGVALRNAYDIDSLQLLMEIDKTISLTLDLDKIYELILVEGARRLIGATHGSVALVENGELVIKAIMGDDWTDELRNTRLKVGEGITGWVAREGRPYLLRDVRQAGEQYASWFKDVQSELAVPLKIGDRVKGVINVDSAVVDGFDEHDQQLLEALAAQAGVALRNAYDIGSLQLLMEIARAISSTFDLDKIYELILVEGARKLVGATHGSVALVENDELVIKATMGDDWTDELRNTRLKVGEGITGWVAKEGKPFLVQDCRQAGEQYAPWFDDVQSELAVPLKIGERVEGVINVDGTVLDCFDERHQDLLEALAGQAAIAIQTAQHVSEREALREIDKVILSARSLDEMLFAILHTALETSRAHYGSILLKEGDKLIIKASTETSEIDSTLEIDDSLSGIARLAEKAIIIRDLEQYPQYKSPPTSEPMKSAVVVPIFESGHVVGMLKVESLHKDAFSERRGNFLEMLAGQAAIALDKAETQKQLIQAENIKAIGMATAQLTHWIDNKALPIRTAIERVIEDIDSEDESVLEDLEIIRRSILAILEIKKSLLGSTVEFQPVLTGIGDLLKDTIKLMRLPDDVKTTISISRHLPLVRIDRAQFSQVLENLIKNALDAMSRVDRENELTISAYFAAEDEAIKIEVRDNGSGIAPENLEKIWMPFFTTKAEGAGIGLSASAQVIRKMHGRIHVETELDVGTTFTIELPAMS